MLLDGITDPHNFGALVRSAEVLGAHGVVVPDRGAAPVTPVVVKSSAGATERTKIARVGNLLKTIDSLRERGVRVLGADTDGGQRLDEVDLSSPVALVVGAEGKGMREAVARRCDACFTSLSAARSRRSTRRSLARSRSTKQRANDKSAECENSPSRTRHRPR